MADQVVGSLAPVTRSYEAKTTEVLIYQIPARPTARFPADPYPIALWSQWSHT